MARSVYHICSSRIPLKRSEEETKKKRGKKQYSASDDFSDKQKKMVPVRKMYETKPCLPICLASVGSEVPMTIWQLLKNTNNCIEFFKIN